MRQPLLLRSVILALITTPHQISAAHTISRVTVTVQSNETLHMMTEFNHTSKETLRIQHAAREANKTVNEMIASQLALEFEVCFPDFYCQAVKNSIDLFDFAFETRVCGQYCDHALYDSAVEILGVCEIGSGGSSNYPGNGCIDFGLTLQAESKPQAEAMKKELGAAIVTSKPVWRDLLETLHPNADPNILNPDIIGSYISQDTGRTWYPSWDKGEELCTNDAPPFYMKLDPDEYLFPTMIDCCRKHYWWNVQECAKPQNRPCPEGWVPSEEQNTREGIMSGQRFGSYPNTFYSGCIPVTLAQAYTAP